MLTCEECGEEPMDGTGLENGRCDVCRPDRHPDRCRCNECEGDRGDYLRDQQKDDDITGRLR